MYGNNSEKEISENKIVIDPQELNKIIREKIYLQIVNLFYELNQRKSRQSYSSFSSSNFNNYEKIESENKIFHILCREDLGDKQRQRIFNYIEPLIKLKSQIFTTSEKDVQTEIESFANLIKENDLDISNLDLNDILKLLGSVNHFVNILNSLVKVLEEKFQFVKLKNEFSQKAEEESNQFDFWKLINTTTGMLSKSWGGLFSGFSNDEKKDNSSGNDSGLRSRGTSLSRGSEE